VLETLELDAVTSRGYAFQIETTYRALQARFRVIGIPIAFVDREHGSSKMSREIRSRGSGTRPRYGAPRV
jgi:dolichol-phosphate mannosyltransferase